MCGKASGAEGELVYGIRSTERSGTRRVVEWIEARRIGMSVSETILDWILHLHRSFRTVLFLVSCC